jgi:hypothetical protein
MNRQVLLSKRVGRRLGVGKLGRGASREEVRDRPRCDSGLTRRKEKKKKKKQNRSNNK